MTKELQLKETMRIRYYILSDEEVSWLEWIIREDKRTKRKPMKAPASQPVVESH